MGWLNVRVQEVGRIRPRSFIGDHSSGFREADGNINFLSVVRCTRAAAPHLIRSRGHLVNIGSLSGKSASRYVGAYSATKFALAAYTQQLRLDLRSQGVHVMLVSPGPMGCEDAGRRYADQMSGLPASAVKPVTGAKIPLTRPEKLSAAILQACRRRQPELIYPGWVRVFIALIHLFPSLGDWLGAEYGVSGV